MDRRGQLRNVAFGGAWSEQIAGDEQIKESLARVERSAVRTVDEDLRADQELLDALGYLCRAHPKGAELRAAYMKALGLQYPAQRVMELTRIGQLLRAALEARLGRSRPSLDALCMSAETGHTFDRT